MIDLLNFYRVGDWIKVLGLVLIGYFAATSYFEFSLIIHLIAASLSMAFARALNNYYDTKIQKEKNYVDYVSKEIGSAKTLFLCFLPLILLIFFIKFYLSSFLSLSVLLLAIALAYVYSAPPFRFRNKTFIELPINVIGGICAFAFVFLYYSLPNLLFYFFIFSIGWYYFIAECLHQLGDFKKDKKVRRITTAIKLGKVKFLNMLKATSFFAFIISSIFLYKFIDTKFLVLPIIFIIINFMRMLKILKLKSDFDKIRTKIYGVEEGLLYLLSLYLFQI